MIHYHGLPITPETAAVTAISGGHAFLSFAERRQQGLCLSICQSFAVDNGAFSFWRSGRSKTDWADYYEWVKGIFRFPNFDWAVIPDVIDGTEADNDKLLGEWPFGTWLGAPVWHMAESLERLKRLVDRYFRICIGSTGKYRLKTEGWWERMREAMGILCDSEGVPLVRIHGLRMLDPKIVQRFPFASADSTNIARNVGIDGRWKGTYRPPTKEGRALVIRMRMEAFQSPSTWRNNDVHDNCEDV